jgi:predicted nucleotide-binding protein
MSTRVFVVKHERNTWAYDAISRFLEAIDVNVVTWEAAEEAAEDALREKKDARRSLTVIDIVNKGFDLASCAVVLMTPDDEARLRAEFREPPLGDEEHEVELRPQPRPNVLFEAGIAWALYEDRTIFVEFSDLPPIEWPSDLHGLLRVQLGEGEDGPRRLARRILGPERWAEVKAGEAWRASGRFTRPSTTYKLNVTVPESTDDEKVYIAGTLDRLDEQGPVWARGLPLEETPDGRWTIELRCKQGIEIEYKLTLGSWDHVEKSAGCTEIRNRRLVFGAKARESSIVVEAWRGKGNCRDGG